MCIKLIAASFIILLAHATAKAAPPPPPLMTPTGPWNVEFADKMCLLSRSYGKDGAINLVLKPGMIGNGLEIIVIKATTAIGDVKSGKAVLAIAGNTEIGDALFTAYSTPKTRLLRISIKDDKIALSAVRGTLSIDAKSESRSLFSIPGIERALPVLSTCLSQLRAIYKVSESELAAIVTEPVGSVVGIFSTNDYPPEAIRNGQFGTVGVLVWIEATGRISTCEIIESSATLVLEQTTCDILKRRARPTPAKDAAGKSVRAPSFVRIRWMLPSS